MEGAFKGRLGHFPGKMVGYSGKHRQKIEKNIQQI